MGLLTSSDFEFFAVLIVFKGAQKGFAVSDVRFRIFGTAPGFTGFKGVSQFSDVFMRWII